MQNSVCIKYISRLVDSKSADAPSFFMSHASRPASLCGWSVSHQTSHLLAGFMGVPGEQLNCSANSRELDKGPRTRNIGRLCESPIIDIRLSSGRLLVHHTCTRSDIVIACCTVTYSTVSLVPPISTMDVYRCIT